MGRKKNKVEIESILDLDKKLEESGCKIIKELEDLSSPFHISTGVWPLDLILTEEEGLGVSCVEIHGPESTGKTSLSFAIMVEAQKVGMKIYYINMERAINKSFVNCFKELDIKNLKIIEPGYGQAAFDAIETILRNEKRTVIVLDSIPACISSSMMEASSEDSFMAIIPRLLSNFMPKARKFVKENENILVLLNQIRSNLSPYGARTFTPGGHSLRFNCDIRIQIKIEKKIEYKNQIIGQRLKFTTVKNRFARPYQSCVGTLIFGEGFHSGYDLLDLGLSLGVINQKGPSFQIGENKYKGQQAISNNIRNDKELQDDLKSKIKELLK